MRAQAYPYLGSISISPSGVKRVRDTRAGHGSHQHHTSVFGGSHSLSAVLRPQCDDHFLLLRFGGRGTVYSWLCGEVLIVSFATGRNTQSHHASSREEMHLISDHEAGEPDGQPEDRTLSVPVSPVCARRPDGGLPPLIAGSALFARIQAGASRHPWNVRFQAGLSAPRPLASALPVPGCPVLGSAMPGLGSGSPACPYMT